MENATSVSTEKPNSSQSSFTKLRSACDLCHQAKVRCSGGLPCTRCTRDSVDCHYSASSKVGKPRGSRNKKTLERLKAAEQVTASMVNNASSELCQEATSSSHDLDQMVLDSALEMLPENFFSEFSNSENLFGVGGLENYHDTSNISISLLPFDPVTNLPITSNMDFLNSASVAQSPFTNNPDDTDKVEDDEDDESDSESNPLDIFNFMSTAGRTLPTPSSLPSASAASAPAPSFQRTPSSSQLLSPIATNQNLSSGREISSEGCQCLQVQFSLLCELRQVEQRHTSIQLDTILNFTGKGYRFLQKTFQCPTCLQDQHCLQIAAMVLHKFLSWIEVLQIRPPQPSLLKPVIGIQVGDYSVNHEEELLLKFILILRLLTKTRTVAQLFQERVQQFKDATEANDSVTEYLQRVATSYFKILKVSRRLLKDKHAINNQAGI